MRPIILTNLLGRFAVLSAAFLFLGVLGVTEAQSLGARNPEGYKFVELATIPGPAPGGGNFANAFIVGELKNPRRAVFGAEIDTGDQGVFVMRDGWPAEITRSGLIAPGGGVFGAGVQGNIASNDNGEVAFSFYLDPFEYPIGTNAGLYRFSVTKGALIPVVVPGVTAAPGGGVFQGVGGFGISLNNRGGIAFAGIVPTDYGIHVPGESYLGVGMGIFRADAKGSISSLVSPGDPAPGGSTFDFLRTPWMNDTGDVAFVGHVASDQCLNFNYLQADAIYCQENVYVKRAATGKIKSIARLGDPAPGGGVYHNVFGPIVNSRGDVAFMQSEVTLDGGVVDVSVFLYSGDKTIAIARPGDPMPGGGHLVSAGPVINAYGLNECGQISFDATLDTDSDADGLADTGLYVWSGGSLRLVARTGTVVPMVGTIAHLMPPSWVSAPIFAFSGAQNNAQGEVLFQATLTDGRGVLLLASPHE